MNADKKIYTYDNEIKAREYMSYIGENGAGFVCAGRDGKIYIRQIGEDQKGISLNLFKTYKFGEEYKISGVYYENGVESFKFGNDSRNILWLNQENIFITDEAQVENIYNKIKGLTINSFEGGTIIDPTIDIGDFLIIDGKPVVYQGDMSFSNGFFVNIKSKISIKNKQETTIRKQSQKLINRRVQARINEAEGKITQLVSETEDTINKTTEIVTDIEGLKANFQKAGGLNLIPNSTLRLGLDNRVSVEGTITIEQYRDIQNNTISKSAIKINTGSVKFDPIDVIQGQTYTFSCIIYKLKGVNIKVSILKGLDEIFNVEAEQETFVNFEYTFLADSNRVQIIISCDDNYCLVSDCMFNSGAKLSYQPYLGEVINSSTVISDEGIKIKNENSKTEVDINSYEAKIVNYQTGETRVSFNGDDTLLNKVTIKDRMTLGRLRNTDLGNHVIGTFDDE